MSVMVASFAEAWIEIKCCRMKMQTTDIVASFAEAWIEMMCSLLTREQSSRSPPSRRRGLK